MILNATHEITLSGLPADVLDAYVRYKKGTRAIVCWIVQYGPAKYAGVRSLPLKELARLAVSVKGVLKEVPDVIHFHFRETIAARKRLSKYFRGNIDESPEQLDTVNHEHFTDSLTQIYAGLCACCDLPKAKCVSKKILRANAGEASLQNHFESLSIEESFDETSTEAFSESATSCSECLADAPSPCPGLSCDPGLTDDHLGNSIELAALLQNVCDVVHATADFWAMAGRGEVHFAAAAFATNIAFSMLTRLGDRMRDLEEGINLRNLRQQCCLLLQPSTCQTTEMPSWHHLLERLTSIQQTCEHHAQGHQPSTLSSCASCVQKPSDYCQPAESESNKTEAGLLKALIDNIIHLVTSKNAPGSIIRNSTLAYADVGCLLANPSCKENDFRSLFALHLLQVSYASYLNSSIPSKVSTCRLSALKLAQQVVRSVVDVLDDKTCFPCRCSQTLAYHLQNLEGDLKSYSSFKCWDLYFQSPWVAGNHILEILDLCHYYGMKLFGYRHYAGAVVHSYNVLQQLAGLEKIPLLEHLCEQYRETFFPGGQRPMSNFRSSWTRYIGARLKFKKGHKSRNHRDSWCMAVPAHAAKKAAGLGISNDPKEARSGCVLFKIKQQDYQLSEQQWDDLTQEHESTNARLTPLRIGDSGFGGNDIARALPNINNIITSTSTTSPSALLNHFSIFASCVRIISSLSDATHIEQQEKGMNCICFVSAILSGADRILEARRVGKHPGACWKKEEREGVLDMAMNAVREEMGGREVEEWCWDI